MSAFKSLSLAMVKGQLRDRTAAFFTLVFPLMFLLLFGALFQNDSAPRSHVLQVGEVAVLDEMPAEQRRGLSEALDVEQTDDREEALSRVSDGDVDAAVWEDEEGRIELRYSAADAARAGTVQGLMQSLVQSANLAATGQPATYELATDQVEDKSVKAIQYLAPGLLGWAIAMGSSFMSAFTLVNWRKKRILRRLWLAPVSPGTVIGARIGVSLGMAFLQTALFLAIAVIPFYGLKLTGSWWLVLPLVASGTLAFMSVGLLIGAWAKSEEAANAVLQLVVMPMAFLSGSFFPLENMPGWLRTVSNVMPLKHLNEASQGVLSRGESWGAALPAIGGLLLFAAVLTFVASRLFRWDDA
ncbi:ABC-2 type transport system permease protein [Streptomyces zhaozhouensis]|uniref:Transport permease protein n=1 Tax=Streptomyces zhaozhouensis TaxID=1300267 RepID=A0A286E5U1_9ACTN|nr:ABC transporter permease [Streptomyces zhaozhouensis]SOD66277.1 ABC-2 type transport system permease protein [Streptomyces zhaozhouensis]